MKSPEEIEALANRIDHEELWRLPGMRRDSLTPEQRDRLDAGVYLRRYAIDRFTVLEELKKGAEYIRGYKLTRADMCTDARGCGDREWHRAINAYADDRNAFPVPTDGRARDWPRMMYAAKTIADEVPRMILLFERERTTGLPETFKMCGHDPRPAKKLPDNHLRCGLGVECRKCPYLAAIDRSEKMPPEAKDEAKAWTCATHFLLESKPDVFFESILRDKSDDAFDDRIAESFGI